MGQNQVGCSANKGFLFTATNKIGDLFHLGSKLVKLYTKKRGFVHRIQKYLCHQFFTLHFYSKLVKNCRFFTLTLLRPTAEPNQADSVSAGLR